MILRLAGLACLNGILVLWIYSLVQYDGNCGGDCGACIFPMDCPLREMKEKDDAEEYGSEE